LKSSRGEIKIAEVLENSGLNFEEEYTFADLVSSSGRALRFDFAVLDDEGGVDFLIEFQGIQHYQAKSKFGGAKALTRQKYNDMKKRAYCLQRNLTLIAIPYWDEPLINYDYIMKAAGY